MTDAHELALAIRTAPATAKWMPDGWWHVAIDVTENSTEALQLEEAERQNIESALAVISPETGWRYRGRDGERPFGKGLRVYELEQGNGIPCCTWTTQDGKFCEFRSVVGMTDDLLRMRATLADHPGLLASVFPQEAMSDE
jgi:hypothetical protein